ncbi:MAG: translation elongation factor Ts [Anaerolineae bacterium]|nr:translation elongation factor Ts [Anaerolineae bacterium]MDH7473738.1 translation elongation factor Ts [Anaerolineae bacterium]
MQITTEAVKELRTVTGAGVLDCKKALQDSNGDFDKAVEYLKKKGLVAAAKRAERTAKDGMIGYYVHMGGRAAALVEVNCETDFVARTEEFQNLAHDMAMQVVAERPLYLSREDVPPEVLEAKREEYRLQIDPGKPDDVVERIIEGKLEKFYAETCLLEQTFIKDEQMTVKDLIAQLVAKTGENIRIRRFVRYELGE